MYICLLILFHQQYGQHTGEKGWDAIAHWRSAYVALGIPHTIKTDSSPEYISQKMRHFLQLWGVSHHSGIPWLATGQATRERAHSTLKHILEKQKKGMCGECLHSKVAKAICTQNHLRA